MITDRKYNGRVNHGHMPEINERRSKRSALVPSLNEMTPQQKVFAEEYMVDLDPKSAAIRAGYPPDRAAYAAATVMKHPPVRDHIARLMAARSKRVGLNADRVLQRLGAIIMGDPRSIYNENGGLKPPSEMSEEDALLVGSVKTRRTITQALDENGKAVMLPEEIVEISRVDLLAAMTLAMKHLGMMNDKLDVNVTHTLADRLAAAHKRVATRGGTGAVIDAEFVEDMSNSLQALEDESEALKKRLSRTAVSASADLKETLPVHLSVEDFF